jgi:hypothetical protein
MVRKIKDEYYLNRSETIDYLTTAYRLKWCMTRWESGRVRITYEKTDGQRGNAKFDAYKCNKSSIVRLRKLDMDKYFLSV